MLKVLPACVQQEVGASRTVTVCVSRGAQQVSNWRLIVALFIQRDETNVLSRRCWSRQVILMHTLKHSSALNISTHRGSSRADVKPFVPHLKLVPPPAKGNRRHLVEILVYVYVVQDS